MTLSNAHTHLAKLARSVDRVLLGPVGVAAVEDELGEAYAALSAADSAVLVGLEPQLLSLIEAGSPAAIVYAACSCVDSIDTTPARCFRDTRVTSVRVSSTRAGARHCR
jgi:hypothetical protein